MFPVLYVQCYILGIWKAIWPTDKEVSLLRRNIKCGKLQHEVERIIIKVCQYVTGRKWLILPITKEDYKRINKETIAIGFERKLDHH